MATERSGRRTDTKSRLRSWLEAPVDAAGLAAFRILFGALMAVATVRFAAMGWIDELYLEPTFHFTYLGFDWIQPWPRPWMIVHFVVMGSSACAVALGLWTRGAALAFFLLFGYTELIEKATYLNHYYLVSLLSLLLVFVPANQALSLDARYARRTPSHTATAAGSVPRAAYWLFRAQLSIVYLYAGLAKLNADWLWAGEPLATWLRARSQLPVVGAWFVAPGTALLMSWAGAAFDLTIPFFLGWRKSRPYAVAVAIFFHGTIWLLFPVGMFSFIMLVSITVFFEPDWPCRLWSRWGRPHRARQPSGRASPIRISWAAFSLAALHLTLQVALPARFLLYPGDVNWTEQGFRFSWRVMLVEKAGQVEFRIATPEGQFVVYPRKELSLLQYRMMATQPDMILQYAHHLRDRFLRRGHASVRVYADAWVAFNGRPSQRLIDAERDLAAVPRSFANKPWILPLDASRRGRLAKQRRTANQS